MPQYSEKYQRIWQQVRRIPKGKVATYGQIARLAGLGRHARMVGYALHAVPEDIQIPWQRVINARGCISLSREDGRYQLQRAMLLAEGIAFQSERINLHTYQWKPETY